MSRRAPSHDGFGRSPFLDRVDRYIVRVFASSYAVAFIFFFGAFVVIDLFANADDFLKTAKDLDIAGTAMARQVSGFYLYQSPSVFLQVAPFVTVIGVIVTLARLQQSNEVVPILMSGRSVFRMLRPIFLCGLVLTVGMIVVQEWVAPRVAARRIALGEHLRDGRQFINVGDALNDQQDNVWRKIRYDIKRSRIVEVTVENKREGVVRYAQAVGPFDYDHTTNPPGWRAKRPFTWLPFDMEGERVFEPEQATFIASSLEPKHIDAAMMEAFDLSFRDLGLLLATTAVESRKPRYLVLLHYHITFPLTNILLILLALPFVIRFERGRFLMGFALAFFAAGLYFGADFALRGLGENHLNPVLAAWFTPIFFGALGISMFDSIRT